MKRWAVVIVLLSGIESAFAGVKPELSLTLSDGTFGGIKSALAPRFSLGGEQGPIEFGLDVDVPNRDSVMSVPKSFWGQTTTNVMGWDLKSRLEYTENKYNFGTDGNRGVYLTLEGQDDSESTFVWTSGEASLAGGIHPLKIGAKKVIGIQDGTSKVMVEPRYNVGTGPDICLGYETDIAGQETRMYLTASADDQTVKICRDINDSNSATVKVGRQGFVSATVQNDGDLGSTKLTVKPGSVDAELSQEGWLVGIHMNSPFTESEPTVRFSKKINFTM